MMTVIRRQRVRRALRVSILHRMLRHAWTVLLVWLIWTAMRRQCAVCVHLGRTLALLGRHAMLVLVDWLTWTLTPRPHVCHVHWVSILLSGLSCARGALGVVLTRILMHRHRAPCVVLVGTRLA
jgi:hypothetical protein